MIIDETNSEKGSSAMMHATFFYYQLLEEGCFSCGQTSYWLYEDYTCWDLLEVIVNEPENVSLGIDECFLREAATIYILCMLENVYSELEEREWMTASERIIQDLKNHGMIIIPEIGDLLECILVSPSKLNVKKYNEIMGNIFGLYVRGRFLKLVGKR